MSIGFFRQEYWSGLPLPSPGDLPDPRINPMSPVSPALQVDSLSAESLGKPPRIQFRVGKGQGTELAIHGPAEQLIY